MRHLSRWQLRLNGRQLACLSSHTLENDRAVFFLLEATSSVYRDLCLSLIRRRQIIDGLDEHLELQNHGVSPVDLEVSLLFDADFADLFEVKDELKKKGT